MKYRNSIYSIFYILVVAYVSSALAQIQRNEVNPEEKIRELGLNLENIETPVANYVSIIQTGNLLYISGHAALIPGKSGEEVKGIVPTEVNVDKAYEAARFAAINILASLKNEVKDLRRIKKIIQLIGMVHATSDFDQHSRVINGASDLFVEVFGPKVGKHTRAAVGMASLPMGATVEITMIVELKSQ